MTTEICLERVLCLPSFDVDALSDGKLICSLPKVQVQTGLSFLLYPMATNIMGAQRFLTTQEDLPNITCWARCEYATILHDHNQITALSLLTGWSEDFLNREFQERNCLFVSHLRVYQLTNSINTLIAISTEKLGKFVGLANLYSEEKLQEAKVNVTQHLPVLPDVTFTHRQQQLRELRPPLYPELVQLQEQVSTFNESYPQAKVLDTDLRVFLGWSNSPSSIHPNSESSWINKIVSVGNSSDGNEFEKLVRKSLISLGFSNSLKNTKASLDPDATGGSGGIDVYCNAPFSLVGECKASKHENVPNSVSAQLIHLGTTHLGMSVFNNSVKVLFVAGSLTDPAEQAATQNNMNVMRPETLQRLVELKYQYPGSINLMELKHCLETGVFGEASDKKVNDYIDQEWQKIKLRAHITKIIQNYLNSDAAKHIAASDVDVTLLYGLYLGSYPPKTLAVGEFKEILIELASPLAGYLGRVPNTDRFYFLRELQIS